MNLISDQKGQTLPVMVLVMIVALSVGVAISTNFIKSIRIASRTDASGRALAVAEALVERLLDTEYQTLLDYINFNSCGNSCILEITGADGVVAAAQATLSPAGGSSDPYEVGLKRDEIVEVSLDGYQDGADVDICWDNPEGELPSVVGTILYGVDGNYQTDSFAYNSIGSLNSGNGFDEATASLGYMNCATVSGKTNPKALRVRSMYNDMSAYIETESGTDLPSQGILISSIGSVWETDRRVEVVLGSPYLPLPFDYVIYSKSSSSPLSN